MDSSRLELRPISTILEAYLAELAARAGVPRPGIILSPHSRRWAADGSPAEATNIRSSTDSPAPLPKPGA
jgi:hypothetical protein